MLPWAKANLLMVFRMNDNIKRLGPTCQASPNKVGRKWQRKKRYTDGEKIGVGKPSTDCASVMSGGKVKEDAHYLVIKGFFLCK